MPSYGDDCDMTMTTKIMENRCRVETVKLLKLIRIGRVSFLAALLIAFCQPCTNESVWATCQPCTNESVWATKRDLIDKLSGLSRF
jgi:hypothetical protein